VPAVRLAILILIAGLGSFILLLISTEFWGNGKLIAQKEMIGKLSENFVAVRKLPKQFFPPFNHAGYVYRLEYWRNKHLMEKCFLIDSPIDEKSVEITFADSEEAYGSIVWIDGRQLGVFMRDGKWRAKP